jgi:hypothetical protein
VNVDVLIDSIVRQTTVLIAQLATAAGVRAPLAHIANQVFVELVRELRQQGVGQKVIADMFGMALRTYQTKVQRLSESSTYGGRSLWEVLLQFIQDKGAVLRADVLLRFRNDDEAFVRAVLRDLVDSGMVFRSGQGEATAYRAATPEEYRLIDPAAERDGLVSIVWVALNRYGTTTAPELASQVPLEEEATRKALDDLVRDGRARKLAGEGEPRYECTSCVIPLESSAGWEAAVFDHFQAMVTAICTKLRMGSTVASKRDSVGGSTYGFDVWKGHPHREEVLAFLSNSRERAIGLRAKVEAYNGEHVAESAGAERVLVYVGQTVLEAEQDGDTE